MKTEQILNEREKTHGDFDRVANLYNALKMEVTWSLDEKTGEHKITYKHILPIDMILLKLARIVCGDPTFPDHWDDIAGYAMLGKGKKACTHDNPEKRYIVERDPEGLHYWHCDECSTFFNWRGNDGPIKKEGPKEDKSSQYCSVCVENASLGYITCPNCLTRLDGIRFGFCGECNTRTIHSYGICMNHNKLL